MSPILESLGIEKLSRDEKLALVNELCDSLEGEPLPPLSEAKRRELDRRIADHEANPDEAFRGRRAKIHRYAMSHSRPREVQSVVI